MQFARFAILIISILLVTVSGDRLLSKFMGDLVLKSNFRFSKMFKGSLKHNILVLGNSRGVNLIDIAEASHLTQSSIFNLSYNGLSMELIEAVLMDYLEHNEHPDLIIIEISSLLQNTAAINARTKR